jgi:hypothetical protein
MGKVSRILCQSPISDLLAKFGQGNYSSQNGHIEGKALKRKTGIAAAHPEAGGTWLGVQHEEDAANACTCAAESI